ncbi:MAG: signal peptidase I [Patescibacteria group bacterium]|jgi:signal peptidase I
MNNPIPNPEPPVNAEEVDDTPSFFAAVGRFAIELVEIVVISLAIILPIRYFLIQPFYVKGASMEPTFDDHEYLIIDELSYRFRTPERGEVVVFRYPLDPRQYFIKRVVGLPGETVKITGDHVVLFNEATPEGEVLDESSYLPSDVPTRGDRTIKLGEGEYFVLGDNRTASLDSRTFGPLPLTNIVGRVWIRGWPIDRVTLFRAP